MINNNGIDSHSSNRIQLPECLRKIQNCFEPSLDPRIDSRDSAPIDRDHVTTPMRVIFGSQIFCAQEFGGISRYFASMVSEMRSNGSAQPLIVALWHINEYASRLPRQLVWGRSMAPRAKPLTRIASLLAGSILQRLRRPRHRAPHLLLPRVSGLGRGVRSVLTVYDMIHEREPYAFAPSDLIARWKARAVARTDQIVCISEHTRRDLLEIVDVPAHKVSVTHLRYDALTRSLRDDPASHFRLCTLGEDRPNLLYVGARGNCKPFDGLLHAYAASPWLRDSFTLPCFGAGGFSKTERTLIAHSRSRAAQVRQAPRQSLHPSLNVSSDA
jgi:glycosyltransferase involved in cell wall biosynthesis